MAGVQVTVKKKEPQQSWQQTSAKAPMTRVTRNNPSSSWEGIDTSTAAGAEAYIWQRYNGKERDDYYAQLDTAYNTQGSKYYDAYRKKVTNQPIIDNLRANGLNVPDNVTDDWINQAYNAYAPQLSSSMYTGTPSSPGKKATADQKIAYDLYQLHRDMETTQKAESEWQSMRETATYWAKKGLSNSEIKAKLNMKDYPTLAKMDESRNGVSVLGLNRNVGYSSDALDGVIWKARNEGNDDLDDFNASVYAAMGRGKGDNVSQASIAKRTPGNSRYMPYDSGATNDEARMLFGQDSFTWDDITGMQADVYASNDERKIKAWQALYKAEDNTQAAEKEKNSLDQRISSYDYGAVELNGRTPEEFFSKWLDNRLDNDYKTLAKMDSERGYGSALDLNRSIDYRKEDVVEDMVQRYYAANGITPPSEPVAAAETPAPQDQSVEMANPAPAGSSPKLTPEQEEAQKQHAQEQNTKYQEVIDDYNNKHYNTPTFSPGTMIPVNNDGSLSGSLRNAYIIAGAGMSDVGRSVDQRYLNTKTGNVFTESQIFDALKAMSSGKAMDPAAEEAVNMLYETVPWAFGSYNELHGIVTHNANFGALSDEMSQAFKTIEGRYGTPTDKAELIMTLYHQAEAAAATEQAAGFGGKSGMNITQYQAANPECMEDIRKIVARVNKREQDAAERDAAAIKAQRDADIAQTREIMDKVFTSGPESLSQGDAMFYATNLMYRDGDDQRYLLNEGSENYNYFQANIDADLKTSWNNFFEESYRATYDPNTGLNPQTNQAIDEFTAVDYAEAEANGVQYKFLEMLTQDAKIAAAAGMTLEEYYEAYPDAQMSVEARWNAARAQWKAETDPANMSEEDKATAEQTAKAGVGVLGVIANSFWLGRNSAVEGFIGFGVDINDLTEANSPDVVRANSYARYGNNPIKAAQGYRRDLLALATECEKEEPDRAAYIRNAVAANDEAGLDIFQVGINITDQEWQKTQQAILRNSEEIQKYIDKFATEGEKTAIRRGSSAVDSSLKMLASGAITAMGLPAWVGTTASFFAGAFHESYGRERDLGTEKGMAGLTALLEAVVEVGSEAYMFSKVYNAPGEAMSGFFGNAMENSLRKAGATKALVSIGHRAEALAAAVGHYTVGEVTQEYAQGMMSHVIQSAMHGDNFEQILESAFDTFEGDELGDTFWSTFISCMINATVHGAFGTLKGGSTVFQRSSRLAYNYEQQDLRGMLDEYQANADFDSRIQTRQDEDGNEVKEMSQEDYNNYRDSLTEKLLHDYYGKTLAEATSKEKSSVWTAIDAQTALHLRETGVKLGTVKTDNEGPDLDELERLDRQASGEEETAAPAQDYVERFNAIRELTTVEATDDQVKAAAQDLLSMATGDEATLIKQIMSNGALDANGKANYLANMADYIEQRLETEQTAPVQEGPVQETPAPQDLPARLNAVRELTTIEATDDQVNTAANDLLSLANEDEAALIQQYMGDASLNANDKADALSNVADLIEQRLESLQNAPQQVTPAAADAAQGTRAGTPATTDTQTNPAQDLAGQRVNTPAAGPEQQRQNQPAPAPVGQPARTSAAPQNGTQEVQRVKGHSVKLRRGQTISLGPASPGAAVNSANQQNSQQSAQDRLTQQTRHILGQGTREARSFDRHFKQVYSFMSDVLMARNNLNELGGKPTTKAVVTRLNRIEQTLNQNRSTGVFATTDLNSLKELAKTDPVQAAEQAKTILNDGVAKLQEMLNHDQAEMLRIASTTLAKAHIVQAYTDPQKRAEMVRIMADKETATRVLAGELSADPSVKDLILDDQDRRMELAEAESALQKALREQEQAAVRLFAAREANKNNPNKQNAKAEVASAKAVEDTKKVVESKTQARDAAAKASEQAKAKADEAVSKKLDAIRAEALARAQMKTQLEADNAVSELLSEEETAPEAEPAPLPAAPDAMLSPEAQDMVNREEEADQVKQEPPVPAPEAAPAAEVVPEEAPAPAPDTEVVPEEAPETVPAPEEAPAPAPGAEVVPEGPAPEEAPAPAPEAAPEQTDDLNDETDQSSFQARLAAETVVTTEDGKTQKLMTKARQAAVVKAMSKNADLAEFFNALTLEQVADFANYYAEHAGRGVKAETIMREYMGQTKTAPAPETQTPEENAIREEAEQIKEEKPVKVKNEASPETVQQAREKAFQKGKSIRNRLKQFTVEHPNDNPLKTQEGVSILQDAKEILDAALEMYREGDNVVRAAGMMSQAGDVIRTLNGLMKARNAGVAPTIVSDLSDMVDTLRESIKAINEARGKNDSNALKQARNVKAQTISSIATKATIISDMIPNLMEMARQASEESRAERDGPLYLRRGVPMRKAMQRGTQNQSPVRSIRKIFQELGNSVRTGLYAPDETPNMPSFARSYYEQVSDSIGIGRGNANNVYANSHEIGHALEVKAKFSGTLDMFYNCDSDFIDLYDSDPGINDDIRKSEGLAEMTRVYLGDRNAAISQFGADVVDSFEAALKRAHLYSAVRKASADIQAFVQAAPEERTRALIQEYRSQDTDRSLRDKLDHDRRKAIVGLIDDSYALQAFDEAVQKAPGMTEQDITTRKQFLMTKYSGKITDKIIKQNLCDMAGHKIDVGMSDAINIYQGDGKTKLIHSVEDYQGFENFRTILNAINRYDAATENKDWGLKIDWFRDQGIIDDARADKIRRMREANRDTEIARLESGLTRMQTDEMLDYVEAGLDEIAQKKTVFGYAVSIDELRETAERLAREHPNWVIANDQLTHWWGEFMRYWGPRAGIAAREVENWLNKWQNYVPTQRDIKDGTYRFMGITGSDLDLISPLSTMQTIVGKVVSQAWTNQMNKAIYETLEESEMSTNDADKLGYFGRLLSSADGEPKGDNILRYVDQRGKAHYFQLNDDVMYNALAQTPAKLDVAMKVFRRGTRAMSMLTTGSNPLFALRNFVRDFQQSVKHGHWAAHYVTGMIKWLAAAGEVTAGHFGHASEAYTLYENLGGGDFSQLGTPDSKDSAKDMRRNLYETTGEKFKSALWRVATFEDVNSIVETTSRFVEFKAMLQKAGGKNTDSKLKSWLLLETGGPVTDTDIQNAFLAAQDVTVNFAKSGNGEIAALMKSVVPFWNATLQGSWQIAENIGQIFDENTRGEALRRIAKGGINGVITGALAYAALNCGVWGNDDDKDWLEKLPDALKFTNIILPFFDNDEHTMRFIRLPLLQNPFGQLFYQMGWQMAQMGEGGEFTLDLMEFAKEAVLNSLKFNTVLNPIFDVMRNRDYNGNMIATEGLIAQNPGVTEQYNESTPWLATFLSRTLAEMGAHVNPVSINYLLKQYSGFFGQLIIPFASGDNYQGKPNDVLSYLKSGASNLWRSIYRSWSLDPSYTNDITDTYYEKLDLLDRVTTSAKNRGFSSDISTRLTPEQQQEAVDEASELQGKYGPLAEIQKQIDEINRQRKEIIADTSRPVSEREVETRKLQEQKIELMEDALSYIGAWEEKYVTGHDPVARILFGGAQVEAATPLAGKPAELYRDYRNGEKYMTMTMDFYNSYKARYDAASRDEQANMTSPSSLLPTPNMTVQSGGEKYKVESMSYPGTHDPVKEPYLHAYTEGYREALQDVIPEWNTLTDEEKMEALSKARSAGNKAAKNWLLEEIDMGNLKR